MRARDASGTVFTQLPPAALSGDPTFRVVDDFIGPLPVSDTELELIEQHLRGLLQLVLCDEEPKA